MHENLETPEAQGEASFYLNKINLASIGKNRLESCTFEDNFYVMFIRALMTKESKILILPLFLTARNSIDIKNIVTNLEILNGGMKSVYILDVEANKEHYEEILCHIAE